MTSSQESFKFLKAELQKCLSARGFRWDFGNWRRRLGDTDQFVNLQRSSDSTHTSLKVTLNIGVNSRFIDSVMGRQNLPREVADCHSHGRISQFMDHVQDAWWWIESEIDRPVAAREIWGVLDSRVIPILDKMSSSAALLEAWSTPGFPLKPDIPWQRAEYMEILGRTDR